MVRILVEAVADSNVRNRFGDSTLIQAIRTDNAEILRILVEDGGADVIVRGPYKYDSTALEVAMSKGSREIVQILVDAGALEKPTPTPLPADWIEPPTSVRASREGATIRIRWDPVDGTEYYKLGFTQNLEKV